MHANEVSFETQREKCGHCGPLMVHAVRGAPSDCRFCDRNSISFDCEGAARSLGDGGSQH